MPHLWAQKLSLESQVVPTPLATEMTQKDIVSDPSNGKEHERNARGSSCADRGQDTASVSLSQAASAAGLLVWPPTSSSAPGHGGAALLQTSNSVISNNYITL